MSQQKLNSDQIKKIASLFTSGLSADAVGRRFGICPAQVRKIVKKAKDER